MFFKDQLVGRYRIRASVGSGGFGSVFLAEDTWLHSEVAVKVPHQQTASLESLLNEPRLLAALDHPNIVRILTVERHEDVFFIVMEYVDGETLADRIDREGPFKIPEFLEIMQQIGSAVSYAHERKVMHRDLRPANIMVTKEGRVKVADFGISRILEPAGHAQTRVGSPPYMAPEQFEGKGVLASDIYALGVIAYEMLTASLPVPDTATDRIRERMKAGRYTPPRARNPAVTDVINDAIVKAMAPEVQERFKRADEFVAALLSRKPSERGEGMQEIRERLRARVAASTSTLCWNCSRPLARRSNNCAHCGEAI